MGNLYYLCNFKFSLLFFLTNPIHDAPIPANISQPVYPGDLIHFPFPGKSMCPSCYLASLEQWTVAWLFFYLCNFKSKVVSKQIYMALQKLLKKKKFIP